MEVVVGGGGVAVFVGVTGLVVVVVVVGVVDGGVVCVVGLVFGPSSARPAARAAASAILIGMGEGTLGVVEVAVKLVVGCLVFGVVVVVGVVLMAGCFSLGLLTGLLARDRSWLLAGLLARDLNRP